MNTLFNKHIKPLIILFTLCYSTAIFAAQSTYQIIPTTIEKSERDLRQYQAIKLKNNMKVLLISDKEAVKSLASLALPVGSLHDPKTQQGLAHYTEHMVLMGSQNYPEPANFSTYLSQHSGRYNASTAQYRTAFYFEVENSAFHGALDRLADAIAAPILDPQYADKERNAVNAELTMARSNDGFRIAQVEAETANQAHPISMFSGGNLETLSDKENSRLSDELNRFYQRYYSADIMVGVIYSSQSLDELADLANQTFGRIKNRNATVEPITEQALTANELGKMIYLEPAQPKKVLYLQFAIENNIAEFADKTDEYLGYLINNRSENTLFDQLQKQGFIESISAQADPNRYGNSGIFGIYVSLTDHGLAEHDRIIAAIFAYLNRIKQTGIDKRYYDEIHNVLALDFKYPDIMRDMSYVEWLSEQMLFYPTQNILNANWLATHFNERALHQRLADLTVENARIWLIAPNQHTDKIAYFIDAPYRIEDVSVEQKVNWNALASLYHFDLPKLNPFIPNDFAVTQQNQNDKKFERQENHFHFTSQYFADEPKAAIVLALQNNVAQKTVENQVMLQLVDYIADRALAQRVFQASVGGVSLSTQTHQGISISASGFNQHLPNLLIDMLATYHQLPINNNTLTLAKSWYLEQLDDADRANSYSLALQPARSITNIRYFDRATKREALANITVTMLQHFVHQLLTDSELYMASIGNISNDESYALYTEIKQTLNHHSTYQPLPSLIVKMPQNALISQQAASTDNALLMSYIPVEPQNKISQKALSYLLYKILSPQFYNQLRSEEQLGYAVFTLPISIGDSTGIGFLIQSNQYDPAYLHERYQAFYLAAQHELESFSAEQFEQYKTSLLNEMNEPPHTLDNEFAVYLNDFYRNEFDFTTKQQLIAKLSSITLSELIDFYHKIIINQQSLVFASQVIGKQDDKTINLVDIKPVYANATELQQVLINAK